MLWRDKAYPEYPRVGVPRWTAVMRGISELLDPRILGFLAAFVVLMASEMCAAVGSIDPGGGAHVDTLALRNPALRLPMTGVGAIRARRSLSKLSVSDAPTFGSNNPATEAPNVPDLDLSALEAAGYPGYRRTLNLGNTRFDRRVPRSLTRSARAYAADGWREQPWRPTSLIGAQSDGRKQEVAFVDASVAGYRMLASSFRPDVEVVLLQRGRDLLSEMAKVLRSRRNLDAVHIVSHGEAGRLRLGDSVFDAGAMREAPFDVLLAGLRSALAVSGDILVYGCRFAEGPAGRAAVVQLAALTGADVAASDDMTGDAGLGGDWDLEVRTGSIEVSPAFNWTEDGGKGVLLGTGLTFIDDWAGFEAALTVIPDQTVIDTDGDFAPDPLIANGQASVNRDGTISGQRYVYNIYDIDFSNTPSGALTPGMVGGDINDLDNINIEVPANQDGATGLGSWGVDTVTGQNSTRNALLFDFTTTPSGFGIGHFGIDLHDVESSIVGTFAQFHVYSSGLLIDQGVIDWGSGNNGDGESHFFGYVAVGPSGLFDQIAIVVGDDDVGGTGFTERLAGDSFTFGEAYKHDPTLVTIGKFALDAGTVTEFLAGVGVDQADPVALRKLLASWNVALAEALADADSMEIFTVLLDFLDPDGDGQVPVVRWETLAQLGTVGFIVERRTGSGAWLRIHNSMLPAMINAPMGAEYRIVDPTAHSGIAYEYRLIEIEARGHRRHYGPWQLYVTH